MKSYKDIQEKVMEINTELKTRDLPDETRERLNTVKKTLLWVIG